MAKANGRRRIGTLLIIGGAADPDDDNLRILPHLVKLAGGKRARIIVCAAASAEAKSSLRNYRTVFQKLGAKEVVDAPFDDRAEGEVPELLEALERATAVFLIGGDQLRITSLLSGTPFDRRLRRLARGNRSTRRRAPAGRRSARGVHRRHRARERHAQPAPRNRVADLR